MAKEITWLEYDWRLDGERALFGVELSLYRKAPDASRPYLCYFCCQTLDEHILHPSDIKRIVGIVTKCSKGVGVAPAGFVQLGAMRQYYFYVASKAEYDRLKEAAAREKKYLCRVGGKREEDWATYFQLLYPNEVKYQTITNREQIEKLKRSGDNPDASRRINLHVAFRTEQQRILFEEAARQAGFAIGTPEFHSDFELPHGSVLYRISTLKPEEIDNVTVRTVKLAQMMEGRLLYWDCNIVPRSVTKRI
ncbi:MAG: DUF695 domain-containing protein [Clostridia bacterium]|nr:DUF695 domain-containing protein [Clostridia bacterium]MBR4658069.1 DUF695 domain-containing protein [Clostridia bacterium]MBR6109392.1 DUF695 domain-containing protein [Clostridia bacterium]